MEKFNVPDKLLSKLKQSSQAEIRRIEHAYLFARQKHRGQKRRSGAPYITHPLRIATRIAEDHYDHSTILASLLHDTLEDTETTISELKNEFSPEVANLVDNVTKIGALRTKSKALVLSDEAMFLHQVDNYRKIFLATASDIRTIIIRLYDRLDNVSTLEFIPEQKRRFYAKETIEIYAPIAERLGMGVVKGQLEDFSFPYAYPAEYQSFKLIAASAYKNPQKVIRMETPVISKALDQAKIKFDRIEGRAKHFFSLFNKIQQGKDIKNIFDIIALRIIVPSIEDCYKTLGIIHSLYQPLPNQIKDYIARPKENGYQSLHTTVSNNSRDVFEIQIRTSHMHEINEFGPAAHWSYKDTIIEKNLKAAEKNRREWLGELVKIKDVSSDKLLIQKIKEELFSKQVFVFTPKGKIIKLLVGSCGLDFAYHVHTDLGNNCAGIKINNRLMTISTPLQNGDVVEVLTSKKSFPSPDWLKFVKTSIAKQHIRSALREKDRDLYVADGLKILNEAIAKYHLPQLDKASANSMVSRGELPYSDLDSALVALKDRIINKLKLLKIIFPQFSLTEKKRQASAKKINSKLTSLRGIRHVFANCCRPNKDDLDLIGYLSREHIIKVHKVSCQRLKNVDERRLVKLSCL